MTGHDFDASDDPVGRAVEGGRSMRAMAQRSTVVLVHGAWHGAWCWDEVVSRLSGDGLDVVAVDLPSVASGGDLYDDARAVRQVLDDTPTRSSSVTPTAASSSPRQPPASTACVTSST
jgi:pimeloyl-ACP methyl ester carboxylesterase